MRGSIDLSSGFVASGDVSSDASELTWQIYGRLGYRSNDHVLGQIGYRYLSIDHKDNGFVWNVAMSGPIAGLSIRF